MNAFFLVVTGNCMGLLFYIFFNKLFIGAQYLIILYSSDHFEYLNALTLLITVLLILFLWFLTGYLSILFNKTIFNFVKFSQINLFYYLAGIYLGWSGALAKFPLLPNNNWIIVPIIFCFSIAYRLGKNYFQTVE